MIRVKLFFSLSLVTLLLTACGGGGGGESGGSGAGNGGADRPTITSRASSPAFASQTGGAVAGSATVSASASPAASGNAVVRLPTASPTPLSPPSVPVVAAAESVATAVTNLPVVIPVLSDAPVAPPAPVASPVPVAMVPLAVNKPADVVAVPLSSRRPNYDGHIVSAESKNDGEVILDGFVGASHLVDITIDKNTIKTKAKMETVSGKLTENKLSIKPLQDIDKKILLGYYGSATAISEEPDRDGHIGTTKYPLANIFYVIDQTKQRLPDVEKGKTVWYNIGEFQYIKDGEGGIREVAKVQFAYKDKMLSGNIHDGRNADWVIDKTPVMDDGTFDAVMKAKAGSEIASGGMHGGFYGEKGQVLAAQAQSRGEGEQWFGVLVLEQSEKPLPNP